MTDHNADRRGELIAAALVGELSAVEAAEFERMRASDPTIDAELAELRALTGQLSDHPEWLDATPSDELRDAVLAFGAADAGADGPQSGERDRGSGSDRDRDSDSDSGSDRDRDRYTEARAAPVTPLRRRRFGGALLAGVAAVGLLVGVVGGFFLPRPETPPPVGDPGTLGAVEPVDFQGEPAGVEIDGSVVAHTWGTETLLTVTGLPSGEFYSVVVVDATGDDVGSGTFLGSEVEINCAVNAAALREEVTSVEIRGESGDVVAAAALPRVEG
ncbi:hypothetical protein [Pseudoclavibacter sp. AY1H1]|uniref:hypothetical protein n=1 Tax=Pseudoclavibacter sp. AY1H1 TaxID=2080584 RepID=UPI000CE7816D|nr:hypothetical protein [Pseudoclavibacter sp. AY1H1]PPF33369.1 hypothetical protein C5E05_17635 [Pseudoclavibacter sp. AY1H1]